MDLLVNKAYSELASYLYQRLIYNVGDRSAHDTIYAILERHREDGAKQPPKKKGYPSEENLKEHSEKRSFEPQR